MSCYHPNIILIIENSIKKKDGKPGAKTKFIPFSSKGYEEFFDENKHIKEDKLTINGQKCKFILAPCGMCQGCKSDRRREWATRLDLESRYYENNLFLTLTYNDENLPIPKWWADSQTGEIRENPGWWRGTLSKEHAKRFIRSLKEHFRTKYNSIGMKYYLAGEYGSSKNTSRPHYHIILLNCPDIPLTYIGKNQNGQPYYQNEAIQKIWNKGFITIGKATWDSMNYVAGYVNKKLYGKKALEDYDKAGKIPEFALMSNGLGKSYFDDKGHKIYENDEIITSKGKSVKPPKYFDRLAKKEMTAKEWQEITEKREEITANETDKKIKNTTYDYATILRVNEEYDELKQEHFNRERINESLY